MSSPLRRPTSASPSVRSSLCSLSFPPRHKWVLEDRKSQSMKTQLASIVADHLSVHNRLHSSRRRNRCKQITLGGDIGPDQGQLDGCCIPITLQIHYSHTPGSATSSSLYDRPIEINNPFSLAQGSFRPCDQPPQRHLRPPMLLHPPCSPSLLHIFSNQPLLQLSHILIRLLWAEECGRWGNSCPTLWPPSCSCSRQAGRCKFSWACSLHLRG